MYALQRSNETFTRSLTTDIINVRADDEMWSSYKSIITNDLKFKLHINPVIMAEERKLTSAKLRPETAAILIRNADWCTTAAPAIHKHAIVGEISCSASQSNYSTKLRYNCVYSSIHGHDC
jgi:hypothetical protein